MKLTFLFIFLAFLSMVDVRSQSQNFGDTIFTTNFDTIICEIILIGDEKILYKTNPKRKKVLHNNLPVDQVGRYTKKGKINNYKVEKEIKNEKREEKIIYGDWIEDNGIIYSSSFDIPPVFQSGVTSLNSYLERTVKVYPGDKAVFGERKALVLYKVFMGNDGIIEGVSIARSSSSTGGFSHRCRALEEEIGAVITAMKGWSPAIVDGEKVAATFYLPLKFSLNGPRIFIHSSKNTFTFNDRG